MERIVWCSRFGLVTVALVVGMLAAPAAQAIGPWGEPGVEAGAAAEPGGGWWTVVIGWLARLVGLDDEVPAGERPGLVPVTDGGERGPLVDPIGVVPNVGEPDVESPTGG